MTQRIIISSGYVADSDELIICDSATAIVIHCPKTKGEGRTLIFKNIGAGAVRITFPDTIDGAYYKDLNQYDVIEVKDYANDYWIVIREEGNAVITTDTISEQTSGAGVTIDGVKLKDKMVTIDNSLGTATMKIHAHSLGVTQEYANEFKGEFLSTGGVGEAATTDGIAAHYHMAASSIGVLRSIIGVAYLDAAKTLSGTLSTGSWISGGLFACSLAATAVLNGTAVIATGIWAEVSSAINTTMTAVNHVAAIMGAGKLLTKPSSGECSLLYLSQEAGATCINQAIYIKGGATVDAFLTIDVAASGKAIQTSAVDIGGGSHVTSHALHIKIGSVDGYIPVWDAANFA